MRARAFALRAWRRSFLRRQSASSWGGHARGRTKKTHSRNGERVDAGAGAGSSTPRIMGELTQCWGPTSWES